MKGRAPKRSATGSQVEVQRNGQPNVARACAESIQRMTPMVAVIAKTDSAKPAARPRKPRSASRDGRRRAGLGGECGVAQSVPGGRTGGWPLTAGGPGETPARTGCGGVEPTWLVVS